MTNNKLQNLNNKQSGLTLVESLVAITVLLVGVLGPLSIAAQGIGDGIFARNQLAANYLAQEALEVVVNKRYEIARQCQYLSPDECADFFNRDADIANCLALGPNDYCAVDPLVPALAATCEPDPDPDNNYAPCQLVFDTGDGVYRPATGVSAENRLGPVFTRKLRLELVSTNELRAIVTVEWLNKDVPRSLTLVTHLFSQG